MSTFSNTTREANSTIGISSTVKSEIETEKESKSKRIECCISNQSIIKSSATIKNDIDGKQSSSSTTDYAYLLNESLLKGIMDERKRYILDEDVIQGHSIWRKEGFWSKVLHEGVCNQLRVAHNDIQWEELAPDALRELVLGIHNVIFGQLGALALSMQQLAFGVREVEKHISGMSKRCQLSEEHRYELLKIVRQMYDIIVRRYSHGPGQLPDVESRNELSESIPTCIQK